MSEPTPNLQKAFAVGLLLSLAAIFGVMIAGFFGALVFGAASALMFYPLQQWLERRTSPNLAATLNLLLLLAVIVLPATFLFGLAASQALSVANEASGWLGERLNADLLDRLPAWFPYAGEVAALKDELVGRAGQIAGAVGRFLVRTISQVTQATALFLLDVFVMAYVFFYGLLRGEELVQKLVTSLPIDQQGRDELLHISGAVTESVLKSIVVIGAVQGLLSGFAFWFVGIESFIFWGVVMGFLSVIPFIGPVIVWLPVAIFLAVTGEYWLAIFLALWFWLVVASVDNVLRPKLVGADTQMPEVLVLLTTLGGLFMFGAIGLIVGPLIGALLMAAWAVYRRAFAEELALDATAPAEGQVGAESEGS